MRISPFYDEIRARALELLTRPTGFNGLSQREIRSLRSSDNVLRNAVGVAICVARDEIVGTLRKDINFNTGNFKKAEAEMLRAHAHRISRNEDARARRAEKKAALQVERLRDKLG